MNNPADNLALALAALANGTPESGLTHLHHAFHGIWLYSTTANSMPHAWRAGDALLAQLAARLPSITAETSQTTGGDLLIASEIYGTGGHTGLMRDYLDASTAPKKTILVLNPDDRPEGLEQTAFARLGPWSGAVQSAPAGSPTEKLAWLLDRLRAQRPERIFLFHHNHDVLSVAGALTARCAQIYLVHHTDSRVCAGLTCPEIGLIDLLPFPHAYSTKVLGIPSRLIMLTVPDALQETGLTPARWTPPDHLKTATNGTLGKFTEKGDLAFAPVIARILQITGGDHLHIGPITDKTRAALDQELARIGIAPTHFQHIPQVPNLSRTLLEERVHLSIGSFPTGGARASLEAMACGIPHLWHSADPARDSWQLHLRYPQGQFWRTPDELETILRRILSDPQSNWLTQQAAASRAQFLKHHAPQRLAEQLQSLPAGPRTPAADDDPPTNLAAHTDALLQNILALQSFAQIEAQKAALKSLKSALQKQKDRLTNFKKDTEKRLQKRKKWFFW